MGGRSDHHPLGDDPAVVRCDNGDLDRAGGDIDAREVEVLARMAEGRSNQAIGEELVISLKTVESHVASILTKLGLFPAPDDHRRVLAVLTYLRSGGATG